MYKNFFKRIIDFVVSLIGLICVSPILLLFTILLAFANKGNPFFIQKRPGKNGKIFNIIKLKTMNDKKNKAGDLLPDDMRLTKTGAFLRRFKIDEIPQLINVLKGDMSLVGPRPGLVSQLQDYNKTAQIRLQVRPGLSGLSQTNGNIYLTWEERWELDAKYVKICSFKTDFNIIFKTFLVIIFGEKKFKKC